MGSSLQKKLVLSLAGLLFNWLLSCPVMAEEKLVKSAIVAENVTNLIAGKTSATQATPLESLLPMLLGLAGILLIIFILAFLLKKVTGLNLVSSNIKILESQNLGAKEKLVIVQIQQKQYVLGVTAHSINQICELKNNIEKKPSMMPFDKIMKQFLSPQKNSSAKQTGDL